MRSTNRRVAPLWHEWATTHASSAQNGPQFLRVGQLLPKGRERLGPVGLRRGDAGHSGRRRNDLIHLPQNPHSLWTTGKVMGELWITRTGKGDKTGRPASVRRGNSDSFH